MTGHELALSTMDTPSSVSVRLNPFKPADSALPILKGASRVPWSPYGYVLAERPVFTLHPLFHAGAYYVQDSSAMYVGHVFRSLLDSCGSRSGKIRVLDLCAAPGGKTTDIAASLRERCGDDFILVANEVMKQRASVLCDNVNIWGDPNVIVTSVDPAAFASLGGWFDIIVADVPCSGEGMFRKDSRAVEDWSEELVALCASRQRRILADVWPALRKDGLLVYSTCTFEETENDDNLEWASRELGGVIFEPKDEFEGVRVTRSGNMLVSGEVSGEGQWVGALKKTSDSSGPHSDITSLRPLRNGVTRGEVKSGLLVPNPDWALSMDFDKNAYPMVPVDKQTALHFLHRDTIVLENAPKGYLVLTYRGLPLGFVKNLGTRCNNLHPKGRRILMDVK